MKRWMGLGWVLVVPLAALAQAGPPLLAFQDCQGKAPGDAVMHTTPEGRVPARCVESGDGLVARPSRGRQGEPAQTGAPDPQLRPERSELSDRPVGPIGYSLAQAVSDRAQLTTIAFNGLAFITGSLAASTFLPPGKVADFFGFQLMRDLDAAGQGHSPQFLDRIAGNVLALLDPAQLERFQTEARSEAEPMRALALRRVPLIAAVHDQLDGRLPPGSAGLNRDAMRRYGGGLFQADAALAYQRAASFGQLAASLSPAQKAALGRIRFGDFNSWPNVDVERYKLGRGTEPLVNVAYMTLASEFFSWYAGSAAADAYFCPERHGTYFGGFFLKDAPAMAAAAAAHRDYQISTTLTQDSGVNFLQLLDAGQQRLINEIVDRQRPALTEIVAVRRAMSAQLRQFLAGATADRATVAALGQRYGELDGELAWLYATSFAQIAATLTPAQRAAAVRLRHGGGPAAAPAYLYSDPLTQLPAVGEKTALFFPPSPQ